MEEERSVEITFEIDRDGNLLSGDPVDNDHKNPVLRKWKKLKSEAEAGTYKGILVDENGFLSDSNNPESILTHKIYHFSEGKEEVFTAGDVPWQDVTLNSVAIFINAYGIIIDSDPYKIIADAVGKPTLCQFQCDEWVAMTGLAQRIWACKIDDAGLLQNTGLPRLSKIVDMKANCRLKCRPPTVPTYIEGVGWRCI